MCTSTHTQPEVMKELTVRGLLMTNRNSLKLGFSIPIFP